MSNKANSTLSSREAALARRRAMSTQGKKALAGSTQERTRGDSGKARARAAVSAPAAAPAALREPQASVAARSAGAAQRAQPARGAPVMPAGKSRAQAQARRAALSKSGRRAQTSKDRVRDAARRGPAAPSQPAERKGECGCGCKGDKASRETAPTREATQAVRPASPRAANGNGGRTRRKVVSNKPAGRLVALARRRALSSRGKGAADNSTSAAGLARQANPRLSSRELAQKVREQRSRNGGAGERKTQSAGRIRAERRHAAAADQPWKVGSSETSGGQVVTGTRVGRSPKATGDEPSTCRTITGTEYLGADIFRAFCQSEPQRGAEKVRVSATSHGNRVTGNEVGRSTRVTGDEPGTCKNVTGTEYLSPDQLGAFCGVAPPPGPRKVGAASTMKGKPVSGSLVGRSPKVTGDEQGAGVRPTGTQYTDAQSIKNGKVETAPPRGPVPPKVGVSTTLSGTAVTGTRVGRGARVTGDEPGSCRVITGDEYADLDQYQGFCATRPEPEPPKVGQSVTLKGQRVSGTQTGRSGRVTGDEPGTCKAVTGTPYAGLEQAGDFCPPDQRQTIAARTRQLASTPGPRMTGQQPGIGGPMTGGSKGACEPITGTPYVGSDQFAATCGAGPGDSDYPRPLQGGQGAPWQQFSVESPARAAFKAAAVRSGVTGTRYETGSQITGPFDMAVGKITGTEQFRFDAKRAQQPELMAPSAPADEPEAGAEPEMVQGPRITGEGQSAGLKITGDDWDRGDRVTGTEGTSARRRNPTRPGPMSAMPPVDPKRNEEVPVPTSRVTGSSGTTERGALVTYSGGARG